MRLLFKLIGRNFHWSGLLGFSLANIVGAIIVIIGIQTFLNTKEITNANDYLFRQNTIVISKPVSTATTLLSLIGNNNSFSKKEIEEIKNIKNVSNVSAFRNSHFKVYGEVRFQDINMSTMMFLQSVPADMIDILPENWSASLDDDELPVIIPETYLNFYNYGFATATNNPQISNELLKAVNIWITISGNGNRKSYRGRIVSFSKRINSILVPDEFLNEANKQYCALSQPDEEKPSRLIISIDGDSEDITKFIEEKEYIIDGGDEASLRAIHIIQSILGAVIFIGLLISVLSFLLLLISIYMLIEKNKSVNNTLNVIGYTACRIALPYQIIITSADFIIWGISAAVSIIVYPYINNLIKLFSPGFEALTNGYMLIAAGISFIIFAAIHITLIRVRIKH